MMELKTFVKNMKIKDLLKMESVVNRIQHCNSLTEKCILAREFLSPQSTHIESIIKKDLEIGNPKNESSGDGCKNDVNYEIKVSLHAKQSKLNFVQIRPDHDIDYYILIAYNMYHDSEDELGKGYIMKVPSIDMYDLVIKYGGYAHGSCKKLGNITSDNLRGRNCEYALRCNPNVVSGVNQEIWNQLLQYETEYHKDNF